MDIDLDNLVLDVDESELERKREIALQADEQSIARPDDNDCGGSCSI